ncbi:MAG: hypothetical protein HY275_04585 [Gemmatimonadetes bacterium]|nr:hypothetical protein [Gemmatimonadota bacterium]
MPPVLRRSRGVALLALAVLGSGCYRGTLVTGLRPSQDVREVRWTRPFSVSDASVAELRATSGCPDGVAKVETHRSLLDQIGSLFDGAPAPAGPLLTVTCAERRGDAATADSAGERPVTPPDSTHRAGGPSR